MERESKQQTPVETHDGEFGRVQIIYESKAPVGDDDINKAAKIASVDVKKSVDSVKTPSNVIVGRIIILACAMILNVVAADNFQYSPAFGLLPLIKWFFYYCYFVYQYDMELNIFSRLSMKDIGNYVFSMNPSVIKHYSNSLLSKCAKWFVISFLINDIITVLLFSFVYPFYKIGKVYVMLHQSTGGLYIFQATTIITLSLFSILPAELGVDEMNKIENKMKCHGITDNIKDVLDSLESLQQEHEEKEKEKRINETELKFLKQYLIVCLLSTIIYRINTLLYVAGNSANISIDPLSWLIFCYYFVLTLIIFSLVAFGVATFANSFEKAIQMVQIFYDRYSDFESLENCKKFWYYREMLNNVLIPYQLTYAAFGVSGSICATVVIVGVVIYLVIIGFLTIEGVIGYTCGLAPAVIGGVHLFELGSCLCIGKLDHCTKLLQDIAALKMIAANNPRKNVQLVKNIDLLQYYYEIIPHIDEALAVNLFIFELKATPLTVAALKSVFFSLIVYALNTFIASSL